MGGNKIRGNAPLSHINHPSSTWSAAGLAEKHREATADWAETVSGPDECGR